MSAKECCFDNQTSIRTRAGTLQGNSQIQGYGPMRRIVKGAEMSKKTDILILKRAEKMVYDRRRYIAKKARCVGWVGGPRSEGFDAGLESAEVLLFNLRKKLEK